MPLISCEINLQLKWSRKCIIVAGTANNQNATFQINDTYVSDVTLSTQENIKVLKQSESGFANWRWWCSRKSQAILSSNCGNKRLYVMIDGRNFFDKTKKNDLKTYDNTIAIVCEGSRWWLHNCIFVRLSLFQKILQINCNRFKQITKTRWRSESNTTN